MIKFPSKAVALCTVPRCKMVLAFGYGKWILDKVNVNLLLDKVNQSLDMVNVNQSLDKVNQSVDMVNEFWMS